jgi:hypothetical protein
MVLTFTFSELNHITSPDIAVDGNELLGVVSSKNIFIPLWRTAGTTLGMDDAG